MTIELIGGFVNRQPRTRPRVARRYDGRCRAVLLPTLGYGAALQTPYTPVVVGTAVARQPQRGGLAFAKTAVNNDFLRVSFVNEYASLNAGVAVASLHVFGLRGNAVDNYNVVSGLGADSGSPGNTLHIVGHSNANSVAILSGSSSQNDANWREYSGVTSSNSKINVVLIDAWVTPSGFTYGTRYYINGRMVDTFTLVGSGGLLPYKYLCANGFRRTTDGSGEPNGLVYMNAAFVQPALEREGVFSHEEAIELTSNPWSLFEPARIWVPTGASGTVYTQSASGILTPAGYILRQIGKATTGVVDGQGSVNKHTTTSTKTGSVTPSADLTFPGSFTQNTTGSITATGVVFTAVTYLRSYVSSLTASGGIVKSISKVVGGTLTLTGSAFKQMYLTLTSAIIAVGAVSGLKFTPTVSGVFQRGLRFIRRFIGRR